jgi:hypothetical protein
MTTIPVIAYKGRDRNGIARGGSTHTSPAELIKRLFGQKWLWAIAERGGVEVGGIGFNEETGQSVWWAEGATFPAGGNALAGKRTAER